MTKQNTIVVVIGKPRHGKSTFGKLLSEYTGMKFGTTSSLVYEIFAKQNDLPPGDWHEIIRHEDQDEVRGKLVVLGDALCELDCSLLPKTLLIRDGVYIIDGIRRSAELESFRHWVSNTIDNTRVLSVWVERGDAGEVVDNTTVTSRDAEIIISNNGTKHELNIKALELVASELNTK